MDLREIDFKKLRLSKRTWLLLLTGAFFVAAGIFGWRHVTHPPQPWLVRWNLNRYLARQAHNGNFKVDFPFPSKAEMATLTKSEPDRGPVRGSRTGKDFETLRTEYLIEKIAALALRREIAQNESLLAESKSKLETLTNQSAGASEPTGNPEANAIALRSEIAKTEKVIARRPELQTKEAALASIVDDLWEFQRSFASESGDSAAGNAAPLAKARAELISSANQQLNSASTYEAMYLAIGRELFVAQRLLDSGNSEHRREAVTIALAATRQAFGPLMNGGVAARICEGYVLPNLDLAIDQNRRSTFNEENLLEQCADIFRRNQEPQNVVRVYQLYLAKNPQRADWARSQIAMTYEQTGDAKNALAAIREIKDTNNFRFLMRRVPRLEQDAKAQSGS